MSGVQDQVISAMDSAKEAAVSVGERVSDFFQGNPFATDIGHKIGKVSFFFFCGCWEFTSKISLFHFSRTCDRCDEIDH